MYYLLLHDWDDFRRNLILWVMVALPVLLSFLIIRATPELAANLADAIPMWVLFAQAIVGIMLTVLNFAYEKEKRTLEALLLTPASYHTIVLAKALFVFTFCVFAQVLVLAINRAFLGNVVALLGLVLLGGAVFVVIGMLIALLVETERSGSATAAVVMVLLFLSGIVYEAFGPLKTVLRFLPGVLSFRVVHATLLDRPIDRVELSALIGWLLLLLLAIELRIRAELRR